MSDISNLVNNENIIRTGRWNSIIRAAYPIVVVGGVTVGSLFLYGCHGDTPTGPENGTDNGGVIDDGNTPDSNGPPADPLGTLAASEISDDPGGLVAVSGATDTTGVQFIDLKRNGLTRRIYAADSEDARRAALGEFFVIPDILGTARSDNRDPTIKGRFWPILPEDVTKDGSVDRLDVALMLMYFGSDNPAYDFNGDGIIGLSDVDTVVKAYLDELTQTPIPIGFSPARYGNPAEPVVAFTGNPDLTYTVKILGKGGKHIMTIPQVPAGRLPDVKLPLNAELPIDRHFALAGDTEWYTFVGGTDEEGHMLEGGSGLYLGIVLDPQVSTRVRPIHGSNRGFEVDLDLIEPLPTNLTFYLEARGDSTQSYGTQPVTVAFNGNTPYQLFVQEADTMIEYVSSNTGVAVPVAPIPPEILFPGPNSVRVEGHPDAVPIRLVLGPPGMQFGPQYSGFAGVSNH